MNWPVHVAHSVSCAKLLAMPDLSQYTQFAYLRYQSYPDPQKVQLECAETLEISRSSASGI
jgi:hypothetical protein